MHEVWDTREPAKKRFASLAYVTQSARWPWLGHANISSWPAQVDVNAARDHAVLVYVQPAWLSWQSP